MKKFGLILIIITTIIFYSNLYAQDSPFIFTAYGGLFFSSNLRFIQISESKSDIIWGVGIALPVAPSLYISGDWSNFNSKAMVNPAIDSSITLEQNFFHIGVTNKRKFFEMILLRISGGVSYSIIKEKFSSTRTKGHTLEGDKKLGYFGGIGFEQPLDVENHLSLFCDVIYDYRRSERKELFGDFGGLRVVIGMHLYVF